MLNSFHMIVGKSNCLLTSCIEGVSVRTFRSSSIQPRSQPLSQLKAACNRGYHNYVAKLIHTIKNQKSKINKNLLKFIKS